MVLALQSLYVLSVHILYSRLLNQSQNVYLCIHMKSHQEYSVNLRLSPRRNGILDSQQFPQQMKNELLKSLKLESKRKQDCRHKCVKLIK